jgi:hypothetical protein
MRKTLFNPSDDFQTAMMLGLFEGVSAASSFALGENLPADTTVVLGTGVASPLLPPDAGAFVSLTSGDAGNAGAVIMVDVLDVAFRPRTVEVIVSGAAAYPLNDPLTGSPLLITRINGARNIGGRDGGEVVEDLTLHQTGTPANIYGRVTPDAQEMQQAVYTVPAGFVWATTSLTVSLRKSQGAGVDVQAVLRGGEVGKVMRRVFSFGLQGNGSTTLVFDNQELISGGSPVDLMLEVTASGAGAAVAGRLTLRLVEN